MNYACLILVTSWERADLLALLCDVVLCFVTFPCCVLGQVWYFGVLIPDLWPFFYFDPAKCTRKTIKDLQSNIFLIWCPRSDVILDCID